MLLELVKKFGDAFLLELDDAEFLDSELSSFPCGSCEVTSQMLALYLESQGVDNVVYTRNKTTSLEVGSIHYWVVADNTIIDLTAHQFEEFYGHCFLPLNSKFHAKFTQLSKNFPDINSLSRSYAGHSYLSFYENVIKRIENS